MPNQEHTLYRHRWINLVVVLCLMLPFTSGLSLADEAPSGRVATMTTNDTISPPMPLNPPVPPESAVNEHWDDQSADNLAKIISSSVDSHTGKGLAMLIPILAILFIFGGPVIIVVALIFSHYRAKTRREQLRSENIAKLLEAGRDIPLELLRGDEPNTAMAGDNLRKGVMNLGLGIGLLIFLTLFLGAGIGAVGFILIGLGVSQLVIWKLADSKSATNKQPD